MGRTGGLKDAFLLPIFQPSPIDHRLAHAAMELDTTFTVLAAYIVSLSVSCIFFGLSLATFVLCMRNICDAPFRTFTRVRWMLFGVTIGMLVIGVLGVGQQLRHNLNAFAYYKGGGHAEEELNDPSDPTNYIHVRPNSSYCRSSLM
jgi:hypothetical protein